MVASIPRRRLHDHPPHFRVSLEAAVAFVDTDAPGGRPWLPAIVGMLAQVLARLSDCERAVEVAEKGIEQASHYNIAGFAPYP